MIPLLSAESSTVHAGVYKMNPAPQAYSMMPPTWVQDKITPPEYENLGMGETAERIAIEYGLTREMCDEFSVLSHKRAAAAWENHRFDDQIVPVEIKDRKKGTITITQDESVRPDCSMEGLAKLRPSFRKDGIVTAGKQFRICRCICRSYGYGKIKSKSARSSDPGSFRRLCSNGCTASDHGNRTCKSNKETS